MELRGCEILIKTLLQEGVDTIFGYPGGAVLDIYDELYHSDIRHILARHEQGAAHAADGYARSSGKVGVCLVTSGPGATNTVTGIATAYMDSVPMVVLTGQVPTRFIGTDAFQEADITGITRPCTKHNFLVRRVEDLALTVREAFHIARTGRPGPVLVDLPKDIVQASIEYVPAPDPADTADKRTVTIDESQLRHAFELIDKAERPVILAGGGIIMGNAADDLHRFASRLSIPVTSTLMGMGSFPGTNPLWLGMLGMHGTYYANMAVSECDLLLTIGVRFSDRVTGKIASFASKAKTIQIDIDAASINKVFSVDIPIVGDCKSALQLLNRFVDERTDTDSRNQSQWLDQVAEWKRDTPLKYSPNGGTIKPQNVIETLYRLTEGDAIITTEVGQNQMWAAQYYHFDKPNRFLTSGGLGTMGYGFPAAIGAQAAFPDKTVIDIAGDGSIQMNIQELATAVSHKLPVKIAILNNGYLGMVRQWQEIFYGKRYAHTDIGETSPDFVRLAEAYGATGLRAMKTEDVEPTIRTALEIPGPVIMDFVVEAEEGVFPMVLPGGSISQMALDNTEPANK